MPTYQTPVSENPSFAPVANQPRMEIGFYQWFQSLRMALSSSPAATQADSVGGKVTVNASTGIITTEALTTAAGAVYALTLTNDQITEQTNLMVTVSNGTNTGGAPILWSVVVRAGAATINAKNIGATALNGSLQFNFLLF